MFRVAVVRHFDEVHSERQRPEWTGFCQLFVVMKGHTQERARPDLDAVISIVRPEHPSLNRVWSVVQQSLFARTGADTIGWLRCAQMKHFVKIREEQLVKECQCLTNLFHARASWPFIIIAS